MDTHHAGCLRRAEPGKVWRSNDQLIDYLLEKGIEPFVTLYHFECPQALVDAFGGWRSRKMIDHYLCYAQVCFEHFKGRVKRWATVNEQLIATAAGIMSGNHEKRPAPESEKHLPDEL